MAQEQDKELEQGTEISQEKPIEADAGKKTDDKQAEKPHRDEGVEQQLNQERANARRIREALAEAQGENDQLVEQLESTRGELAQMKTQLKEHLTAKEYKDLADLDPESTDVPDLVKAFQGATAKIRKLEESNEKLSEFIAEQENRQKTEQATSARRQQEEELYGACDEEFGAQYRNAAIQLADLCWFSGNWTSPLVGPENRWLGRRWHH